MDVGANVGLVSLVLVARGRRAGVSVHSFEPDPANAAAFRQNLSLNPKLPVCLNEAAAGAEAGSAQFRPGPAGEGGWGRLVGSGTAEPGGRATIKVDVVRLDNYLEEHRIDRVDALKIDVEGFEPEVLRGLDRTLAKQAVGAIVCEVDERHLRQSGWTASSLFEMMTAYGYRAQSVPMLGARRLIPPPEYSHGDVIFLPNQTPR